MNNKSKSYALMAMALLVLVVLACSTGDETEKANKLVGEGNAAVQEANTLLTDAEEHRQKMLHTDVAQLDEARAIAKETITLFEKAEAKCKEAAKKYEEASALKIKDKFKEYLTLKTKEYKKRAELVETAKGTPQALIDSENREAFISKANATNEKVDAMSKEAADLGTEAEKLQKDNPDIFKS